MIRAGSMAFSVREHGSGEPLVLLHGIGSSSGSWAPFLEVLQGRHLVAWDAPGYGESTPLAAVKPSAADYADSLATMLDAMNIRRTALVGHSLGALMATAFAAANPQRVAALILIDPAAGYGAATPEARNKMVEGRLGLLKTLGPKGMAEQRSAALLSSKASLPARELVKENMGRVNPAGYEQAVHMLAAADIAKDAARYGGRVLVMCGSEDTVTPEEGCRKVAAAFANAEYRTLPGLGHASYVESPKMVAKEVERFLNTTKAANDAR